MYLPIPTPTPTHSHEQALRHTIRRPRPRHHKHTLTQRCSGELWGKVGICGGGKWEIPEAQNGVCPSRSYGWGTRQGKVGRERRPTLFNSATEIRLQLARCAIGFSRTF